MVVIKIGGEVIDSALDMICRQIRDIYRRYKIIIVHGGGRQVSELSYIFGLKPRFIDGRRVTDKGTLEVLSMVLGNINVKLTSKLFSAGVPAVGFFALSGGFIIARRRGRVKVLNSGTSGYSYVDFGFVGDVDEVDRRLVEILFDGNFLPVIAPLSVDRSGVVLNINADTIASVIAVKFSAEKLIFLTGVDGIFDREGVVISKIGVNLLDELISSGVVKGGMLPKVDAIKFALRNGVGSAHIVNGLRGDSIIGVLNGEEIGTRIEC
jgi:acetylglutamate kinase